MLVDLHDITSRLEKTVNNLTNYVNMNLKENVVKRTILKEIKLIADSCKFISDRVLFVKGVWCTGFKQPYRIS